MNWHSLGFVVIAWLVTIASLVATFAVEPGSAGKASPRPAPKRPGRGRAVP